jgi:hypothetical protein
VASNSDTPVFHQAAVEDAVRWRQHQKRRSNESTKGRGEGEVKQREGVALMAMMNVIVVMKDIDSATIALILHCSGECGMMA